MHFISSSALFPIVPLFDHEFAPVSLEQIHKLTYLGRTQLTKYLTLLLLSLIFLRPPRDLDSKACISIGNQVRKVMSE